MSRRLKIVPKTRDEIEKMRAAGRVVHQVHEHCQSICKPGITTKEIDEQAGELIKSLGGVGLFLGYPGPTPFPSNLCMSVNEVVVHGIADERVIQDGDIVGIDCGVSVDGWCGDAARTHMVGNVDERTRKLCEVTQEVLKIAIDNVKPGIRWSQVARQMQHHAENQGMSVVKNYVGHGIGQKMHEDPQVPNYVDRYTLRSDFELIEGMVLAIEPMCNQGKADTVTDHQDAWTVRTVDGKPSAHYEHTIAITKDGSDVLTDGR